MTKEDVAKMLAVLKAAYPNSFKMGSDDAMITINVWHQQFSDVPAFLVSMAIRKLIPTHTFPPSICEIKETIERMHYEAQEQLLAFGRLLQEEQKAKLKAIIHQTEQFVNQKEPTILALMSNADVIALEEQEVREEIEEK